MTLTTVIAAVGGTAMAAAFAQVARGIREERALKRDARRTVAEERYQALIDGNLDRLQR